MDKQAIIDAMADLEEDELYDYMNEIMDNDGEGVQEALEACQEGMKIVGDRFEEGEYFVGDLIYAGEILTEATNIIKPALTGDGQEKFGKMILCTVKNDLHDIGKNIVRAMLEAGGFEVVDLGIDVDPQTIVDTAKNEGIKIIALSGVLTLAVDSMKDTIEAFKAAGMRDDVKIIVGGAPVTETVCASVGADEWALSPQKTVSVCQGWAS
ncbi:MAG: cobalamin-dependent protein [Acutalibacteraceae bacterium]|nr:cobalamin-dependent protein [Acutalibacteraceae bacterium]MEE1299556.1 cobalamin-dependent protein [Acutalibacteraceae bacterium]MEE3311513.1 cobalamin-dependent protein [Acutalibacteraceae bacterium]